MRKGIEINLTPNQNFTSNKGCTITIIAHLDGISFSDLPFYFWRYSLTSSVSKEESDFK